MSEDRILSELADIVFETTRVPQSMVTLNSSFADDLDIDSLSMVEIATAAEDHFGVTIPDKELTNLVTVRDAVEFIAKAGVSA